MALMAHAFVDTSAWFAYVNRLDADHTRIRSLFQTFQGRLVTSNFIFDEIVTLCLYRLGDRGAAIVGKIRLDPTVLDLLRLTPEDEHRAWTLFLVSHAARQNLRRYGCYRLCAHAMS
jgi:uncharacterized protein